MSTLLFGLQLAGVTARLWNQSFNHNDPPPSFDASIGYPGVWDVRATSEDEQSIGFQNVPAGLVRVWFRKRGYVDQAFDTTMPDDGAKEIRLVKAPPVLLPLHNEGAEILDSNGVRYIHQQATNYLLAQRHANGQDISNLLYEGFDGYNVTFLMKTVPEQAGLPPFVPTSNAFYDQVAAFLTDMADAGKRIEATLLCDCQQLGFSHDQQVRHTETLYDILRDFPWNLVQLANEPENNGVDFAAFNKPAGLFWSRGSSLAGGKCPLPAGDYSTAHLSRDGGGAYLDAQPYYMIEGYSGYAGTHGPVITNETRGASDSENSGRRTTDASYFRKIASAMKGWNGGTFHMDRGIHSDPCPDGSTQDQCRLGFLQGIGD